MDKRTLESKLVQEFRASSFWGVFIGTLKKDWQELHVQLRAADASKVIEVSKIQGKLEYIQEILDLFNEKAEYEILLKQAEQASIEANDY